jgi:hypothetical protein
MARSTKAVYVKALRQAEVEDALSVVNSSRSPWNLAKIAVTIGIAYFLASRLGLILRAEPDVAVFWPAAGIAVGASIALGPGARLPLAIGIFVATIACLLTIGRNAWLAIAFALLNAGQPLFTAWLLERWFGARSSWKMCSEC